MRLFFEILNQMVTILKRLFVPKLFDRVIIISQRSRSRNENWQFRKWFILRIWKVHDTDQGDVDRHDDADANANDDDYDDLNVLAESSNFARLNDVSICVRVQARQSDICQYC